MAWARDADCGDGSARREVQLKSEISLAMARNFPFYRTLR